MQRSPAEPYRRANQRMTAARVVGHHDHVILGRRGLYALARSRRAGRVMRDRGEPRSSPRHLRVSRSASTPPVTLNDVEHAGRQAGLRQQPP